MSIYPPDSRGRRRRRGQERTQQLYEARTLPMDAYDEAMDGDGEQAIYTPNELYEEGEAYAPYDALGDADADGGQAVYTPNEPYEAVDPFAPYDAYGAAAEDGEQAAYPGEAYDAGNAYQPYPEEPLSYADSYTQEGVHSAEEPFPAYEGTTLPTRDQLSANLSAYYRRPGLGDADAALPADVHADDAYARPSRADAYGAAFGDPEGDGDGEPETQDAYANRNVYHPRAVTWAQPGFDERAQSAGYQVQEDQAEPVRRRRKHRARRVVALVAVLALLGGGAYVFRDKLGEWVGMLTGNTAETSAPLAAISTPAPARGYDAAAPLRISNRTSTAISDISGTLEMEPYLVTQESIMTRNARPDGTFDFYMFGASDGKLLAYFEGLGERDVAPLPDGGFYIRQEPYLVADDGSAMIKNPEIERILGDAAVLHPMMNGFALVSDESGSTYNYVGSDGALLSRLWFARAFPTTGKLSVAYVDTGNVTDTENRYSLYVLGGENASLNKWFDAGDMTDVVASACGMVYMNTGELYALDSVTGQGRQDEPLMTTDEVSVYADCDAMVVRDPSSGKYGLFVHGERHYDFSYDSITPVECDMVWARHGYEGAGGTMALYNVVDAAYPQPLSHYFRLLRDGREEFVALSTSSGCPVLLE